MCDPDVRRHIASHVQERAQLAPRSGPRLREHPHRALRQQGGHQGPQSQGQVDCLSQEKEPAGQ